MRNLWQDMMRSAVVSIGMAMAIFCIIGVVFDVRYSGQFSMENYQFTKMVAGCVVIGLGFGMPSVVYRLEHIPLPMRVVIHMGIGLVVYMIVAYSVGWIGAGKTLWTGFVMPFMVQIAVAFVIWFAFMRHYQKEAEDMNRRIKAMK